MKILRLYSGLQTHSYKSVDQVREKGKVGAEGQRAGDGRPHSC